MIHYASVKSTTARADTERFGIFSVFQKCVGRGILVIEVADSWPVCHEFEPSTAEDPSCWGAMHVKSGDAQTSFR
ncbi:hypothetical protein TNCV_1541021 [Trichonephila clavipes]|nr:hypothetical protein TNCV_1541021 [Trichonephila clavipes]